MSFFYTSEKYTSLLSRFDMFGIPITVRFNGDENHKTKFGSIVTLSILIVFFYQAFVTVNSLLHYNIVLQPTSFDLVPTKFTFAFGIQDTSLKTLLDEQIYYVEAVYADTRRKFNQTTSQYEFVTSYVDFKPIPCTEKHFQVEGAIEYFLKLPYKNLYCLPLDISMTFQGQFGADIYKWLRFRLKKCTDPAKCKAKADVDYKMSNCNFQVYYVNYAVEITDKLKPFKPIGQNTFWKPSSTLKNINMYFRNSFIESYEGLFKTDIQHYNALLYSFDRDQIVNTQSDIMFELYVQLEKNKESQYIRKYQTLSEVISYLGGFFNFLFAFGAILCYPFSKFVLHQKLLNNIFKFEASKDNQNSQKQDNNNKKNMDQNKQQSNNQDTILQNNQLHTNTNQCNILSSQSIQNSPNSSNYSLQQKKSSFISKKFAQPDGIKQDIQESQISINTTKNNIINQSSKTSESQQQSKTIKDNMKQINTTLKRRQQQREIEQQQQKKIISSVFKVQLNDIKIKVFDVFSSFFCQRKSHQKMINYGLNKLNYYLDIETIITKLLEIEKLKQLVLNENQIKLFEFIPQPVIHYDQFNSKTKQEFQQTLQQNPFLKTGIFYEDRRSLVEKSQDAQDAYNKIFKSLNCYITSIDKKLLQLLDPRVSFKFDQNHFIKCNESHNDEKEFNNDSTQQNNNDKESNNENIYNILSVSQQIQNERNECENLPIAIENYVLFGKNISCNKSDENQGS